MKNYALFIVFGILLSSSSYAQSEDSTFWQAHLITDWNVAMVIPVGDFRTGMDRNLGGFGFSALINLNERPGLFAGLQVSNFKHSRTNGIYFLSYEEFIGDFDVSTFSSLTQINGTIRVIPFWRNRFTPFIEAFFGGKRMATRSEVADPFQESDEPYDAYNEFSQWGISYGGTAGLYYRLVSKGNTDILLNLSAQYIPGLKMDYYTSDTRNVGFSSTPLDNFDAKFSITDLWQVNFGLTFAFGRTYYSD